MRRSICSLPLGTDALSRHGALVPRCLTSQQQVGQRKTPVDWAFVSPVSLVSLILKLIDRIMNERWERHIGAESWRTPPALRQVGQVQQPRGFKVRHRSRTQVRQVRPQAPFATTLLILARHLDTKTPGRLARENLRNGV
jgi:hypothetical protein